MIRRALLGVVRRRLRAYPAVALVGPRQSGKTTLARAFGGRYFDLEQEPERLRLDLQWEEIERGRALAVLDEAQSWPELFPRLRSAIDRDRRRNGRFLLLGSVSPTIMVRVSESLAGRLALVELSPFSLGEVPKVPLTRLWNVGGYPDGGVLGTRRFPQWQRDYLTLLAQRDLPAWGLPAKPQVTLRLLRMLAAVNGQAWNATQIGQSLGLSYHTVNSYLDYLEGAFLIRRLPPWHANVGRRLVKSPKVYWRDSGMLHSLLGGVSEAALLDQPWVGASWEGFVIEQVLAHLAQRDRGARRSSSGRATSTRWTSCSTSVTSSGRSRSSSPPRPVRTTCSASTRPPTSSVPESASWSPGRRARSRAIARSRAAYPGSCGTRWGSPRAGARVLPRPPAARGRGRSEPGADASEGESISQIQHSRRAEATGMGEGADWLKCRLADAISSPAEPPGCRVPAPEGSLS